MQDEKKKLKTKVKKKGNSVYSIKAKVAYLSILLVFITVLANLCTVIPRAQKIVSELAQNYLHDMGLAYGVSVDEACMLNTPEAILVPEHLEELVKDAHLEGIESSYAYVVDFKGLMLYHPTTEKIGQQVENVVINTLVAELAAGKDVKNDVVEYEFRETLKYASYYIGQQGDFILVVSADEEEIFEPLTSMITLIILSAIGAVIICIILAIVIAARIARPITIVTGVVDKLAALDFTSDVVQEKLNARKDESGDMSRAITHLREELGNIIYDLQQQSEYLFQASMTLSDNTNETIHTMEQVERAAHDIADGATSQADETEKATSNVVTIGDMVQATTSKVTEIYGIVLDMQKDGNEASEKIQELDRQNEKTKTSIQTIYEQTNMTNQSAQKIREATALITSIAEETSLLSLNASIEAARAGDQGRGFAVVAAQIQKLAEQSNESASRIEEIVTSLIADSEQAVETMEEVKQIMTEQVLAVENTGKIFARVRQGIENTKEGVDAIADHAREMDEARVKVVDVVQNLTAIAEENAASTEQTSASVVQVGTIIDDIARDAGQVKEVAQKLDSNIDKFKL